MRRQSLLIFLFFNILLLFGGKSVFAQKSKKSGKETKEKMIQITGMVVTGDSSKPVPFVSIIVSRNHRGTTSDFYGFFTLAVQPNDTVVFTALGFKKSEFLIPDTIKGNHYSLFKTLKADTVMLKMAVVRPWPPIEQFKQIFLAKKVPDDNLERAKKNLNKEDMRVKFDHFAMDGSMNFKNTVSQRSERMYYAGQYPPNRLLDPLAWSKFIDALKKGELKRKME